CGMRSYPKARAPGQEDKSDDPTFDADHANPDVVNYYGFILQSVPGTVALATWGTKTYCDPTGGGGVQDAGTGADPRGGPGPWTTGSGGYQDGDALTPGATPAAVGDLPIAMTTDRAGCQLVTANSGSCDLSIVDIPSLVDQAADTKVTVTAQGVTNATGT